MVFPSTGRLAYSQELPLTLAEAWEFFSRPENLARITPPELGFEVTSELPEKMYAGMIVTYRIVVLPGVKVPWVTEITQVREPEYFVDEQRSGPYRLWHHQHQFEAVPGGVRMTDLVHYQLPFGKVGDVLAGGLVRRRLERIFTYRREILEKMFGRL